jgi:hypothetical protein
MRKYEVDQNIVLTVLSQILGKKQFRQQHT